ncbi:MAG: dipeptide epimerase [Bacteroidetes bacterium]|nr:dipeptide epimerase [Bacteroidota bacterium]
MKIIGIDLFKANIPFWSPFRIALGSSDSTQNVFVRIRTDSGLYGWGEGSPTSRITGESQGTVVAVAADLAQLLLGMDPLEIERHTMAMRDLYVHNTTARCAFDMALYDLAGKATDRPLFEVLGGTRRVFFSDNTIGIDDPDAMAKKAVSYQEEGFQAIKVKLGTGLEDDVRRIESIRAAIGPETPLRIDANQGWTRETAKRVLDRIKAQGIEYCEQPVKYWDYEGLREVKNSTSIPIMADESVFDHNDAEILARDGCCDLLNIKLAKSAGIFNGMKIADIAEDSGMACMVGSMSETRLGLSASAHLVSAREVIRFADLDTHYDHKIDPVLEGVEITPEGVTIPDAAGHGADLDPEFLASCESVTIE